MKRKVARDLPTALKTQYSERSQFLHLSLKAIRPQELLKEVSELDEREWTWDEEILGITADAAAFVSSKSIKRQMIFCHPQILIAMPHLVAYYRNIAGLTQKGLSKLAAPTREYELGTRNKLDEEKALKIAVAINRLVCDIIRADSAFELADAHRNLIASLGITLDGSWTNKIGETAAKEVSKILLKYLKARKLVVGPHGSRISLRNEVTVKIGSDPDIAITSGDGKLLVSIEVKGGIDAAGALERYGAARKSFDKSRKNNVRCHTVYLASCITTAVKERIDQDGLVSETVDLLELLAKPKRAQAFLDDLFNHIVRI